LGLALIQYFLEDLIELNASMELMPWYCGAGGSS